ncbi:MAG TPA: hypothetical protein VE422_48190 [Terriglobia bacterium]|nr:hypothetical protein [Terriglobia bacterium]
MRVVCAILLLVSGVCRVSAQQPDVAKANDPLAEANAINFQDYYQSTFYAVPDEVPLILINAMNLRGVVVSGRHVVRATLPLMISADGDPDRRYRSGLGDLTIFDAIVLTRRNGSTQFAIGPLLVAPTATHKSLGAGKWQAGADAVIVKTTGDGNLFGGLVTAQTSFAGDRDRRITRLATFQPLSFYQIGGGYYFRSTAISVMDFKDNRYLFPIGLGVGKVFRVGDAVGNAFFEPQVTVYAKGLVQPTVQLLLGLNLQWFKTR